MKKAITGFVVGLVLATAGTATAVSVAIAPNSVGSRQIMNHSIRAVDIAPAVLRGQKGQDGAPGLPGTNGLNGGFDPTKIRFVETSFAGTGSVGGRVECPQGMFVISGGGSTDRGSLWGTGPSGAGWSAFSANGAFVTVVRVFALCASQ